LIWRQHSFVVNRNPWPGAGDQERVGAKLSAQKADSRKQTAESRKQPKCVSLCRLGSADEKQKIFIWKSLAKMPRPWSTNRVVKCVKLFG
jgi:hypothetical protein